MACGTGKTFTSLQARRGERRRRRHGARSWSLDLPAVADPAGVGGRGRACRSGRSPCCSDAKAHRSAPATHEDISVPDLALPATTDVAVLKAAHRRRRGRHRRRSPSCSRPTSRSTSSPRRSKGSAAFDLIVCDEAHRTTGVTLAGEDESAFVRVHDDDLHPAAKRLYMTATPRIYDDASKTKAGEANAVLASMDDEALYGPEFHRLGFGEAVERGLLTDYKVLVLAVDEESVAAHLPEPSWPTRTTS